MNSPWPGQTWSGSRVTGKSPGPAGHVGIPEALTGLPSMAASPGPEAVHLVAEAIRAALKLHKAGDKTALHAEQLLELCKESVFFMNAFGYLLPWPIDLAHLALARRYLGHNPDINRSYNR